MLERTRLVPGVSAGLQYSPTVLLSHGLTLEPPAPAAATRRPSFSETQLKSLHSTDFARPDPSGAKSPKIQDPLATPVSGHRRSTLVPPDAFTQQQRVSPRASPRISPAPSPRYHDALDSLGHSPGRAASHQGSVSNLAGVGHAASSANLARGVPSFGEPVGMAGGGGAHGEALRATRTSPVPSQHQGFLAPSPGSPARAMTSSLPPISRAAATRSQGQIPRIADASDGAEGTRSPATLNALPRAGLLAANGTPPGLKGPQVAAGENGEFVPFSQQQQQQQPSQQQQQQQPSHQHPPNPFAPQSLAGPAKEAIRPARLVVPNPNPQTPTAPRMPAELSPFEPRNSPSFATLPPPADDSQARGPSKLASGTHEAGKGPGPAADASADPYADLRQQQRQLRASQKNLIQAQTELAPQPHRGGPADDAQDKPLLPASAGKGVQFAPVSAGSGRPAGVAFGAIPGAAAPGVEGGPKMMKPLSPEKLAKLQRSLKWMLPFLLALHVGIVISSILQIVFLRKWNIFGLFFAVISMLFVFLQALGAVRRVKTALGVSLIGMVCTLGANSLLVAIDDSRINGCKDSAEAYK